MRLRCNNHEELAWLQSYKAWCDNAIGHNGFKLQALSPHSFSCMGKKDACMHLPSHPSVPPSLTHCFYHQGEDETGEQEQLWSSVSEGVSH